MSSAIIRAVLEIVRGIYEAWARGDFTTGPAHFHPEIRFESFMPDSANRYVTYGLDGIVAFMGEFLPSWREYRIAGERFLEIDERTVLVEGRQDGVGRYSGALVRDPVFSVWTFEGDRVVRLIWERDREAALRSVG